MLVEAGRVPGLNKLWKRVFPYSSTGLLGEPANISVVLGMKIIVP